MKRSMFCTFMILVMLVPAVASAQGIEKTNAWEFENDYLVINLPVEWWGWDNKHTISSESELAGYMALMTGLDQGQILDGFGNQLEDVAFVGLDGLDATVRVFLYLNDAEGIERDTPSATLGETAFGVEFEPLDIYGRDVSFAYTIDDIGLVQLWLVETFQGQVIMVVQVEALTEYWILHESEMKAIALSVRLAEEDPELNANLLPDPPSIGTTPSNSRR